MLAQAYRVYAYGKNLASFEKLQAVFSRAGSWVRGLYGTGSKAQGLVTKASWYDKAYTTFVLGQVVTTPLTIDGDNDLLEMGSLAVEIMYGKKSFLTTGRAVSASATAAVMSKAKTIHSQFTKSASEFLIKQGMRLRTMVNIADDHVLYTFIRNGQVYKMKAERLIKNGVEYIVMNKKYAIPVAAGAIATAALAGVFFLHSEDAEVDHKLASTEWLHDYLRNPDSEVFQIERLSGVSNEVAKLMAMREFLRVMDELPSMLSFIDNVSDKDAQDGGLLDAYVHGQLSEMGVDTIDPTAYGQKALEAKPAHTASLSINGTSDLNSRLFA